MHFLLTLLQDLSPAYLAVGLLGLWYARRDRRADRPVTQETGLLALVKNYREELTAQVEQHERELAELRGQLAAVRRQLMDAQAARDRELTALRAEYDQRLTEQKTVHDERLAQKDKEIATLKGEVTKLRNRVIELEKQGQGVTA